MSRTRSRSDLNREETNRTECETRLGVRYDSPYERIEDTRNWIFPRGRFIPEADSLGRSLTILLPVHNAQAELASQVTRTLDVAGELTDRLQLLIIDDGSADHTVEVAQDLALRFPQVEVLRTNASRGFTSAIEAGRKRAAGDVVMAHDGMTGDAYRVDLSPLLRLWNEAGAAERLLTRPGATLRTDAPWTLMQPVRFRRERLRKDRDRTAKLGRPNFLKRIRDFALEE